MNDIDAYHAALAPGDRATCDLLRARIGRALPDATGKVWHRHPVWFLDDNPIVGYHRLKEAVRLMFWSGQGFTSEGLEKTGTFRAAEARYLTVDDVDVEALDRWLAEARDVQFNYRDIRRLNGRMERL